MIRTRSPNLCFITQRGSAIPRQRRQAREAGSVARRASFMFRRSALAHAVFLLCVRLELKAPNNRACSP
jgi:hypothetical protein